MKIVVVVLSVLVLFAGVLFALAPHPPRVPEQVADVSELETYLTALTDNGDPPSVAVAVMQDDDLVYSAAFGTADPANNVPATSETVYHWWSMTKLATAVAVLQLHENGVIHIDDPVVDYLPFFIVEYPDAGSSPITIRHLLNHTSGLPDTMPTMMGWLHFEDEVIDQTALLEQELPNYQKLRFNPGSDSAYSNLGYMVLGAVISAASGQPYEMYVAEQVLMPLGMTETGFVYSESMAAHEAIGSHPMVNLFTPLLPIFVDDFSGLVQRRVGTRYWFNRFYIDATPPTGLIGPVVDAAKLTAALGDNSPLLAPESIALMRPQGAERPLGWAEFSVDETRAWVQHRGGGPGFAAITRLYPDEGIGITLVANGTNLDGEALVARIANLEQFK